MILNIHSEIYTASDGKDSKRLKGEKTINISDINYNKYALVREMMDTIDVVKNFDPTRTEKVAKEIKSIGKLFLAGEGSSLISPARDLIRKALTWALTLESLPMVPGSRHNTIFSNLLFFARPIPAEPKKLSCSLKN